MWQLAGRRSRRMLLRSVQLLCISCSLAFSRAAPSTLAARVVLRRLASTLTAPSSCRSRTMCCQSRPLRGSASGPRCRHSLNAWLPTRGVSTRGPSTSMPPGPLMPTLPLTRYVTIRNRLFCQQQPLTVHFWDAKRAFCQVSAWPGASSEMTSASAQGVGFFCC